MCCGCAVKPDLPCTVLWKVGNSVKVGVFNLFCFSSFGKSGFFCVGDVGVTTSLVIEMGMFCIDLPSGSVARSVAGNGLYNSAIEVNEFSATHITATTRL